MDGTDTVDGLAWWAGPGQDPRTAFARVQAHPARARAVRVLAANMTDLFDHDPLLAEVLKDAGHYMAAMLAFLLHETGVLTLSRLKAACVSTHLLSPGRARSLLQFLEHVGYAERRGRSGGCDAFAITPAFRSAWTLQVRSALAAARVLEPGVSRLLDRPEAMHAFACAHAGGLLDVTTRGSDPPPVLRVFHHAYGGAQILWTLILAHHSADDFAPARVGPISISALAKRFEVSRIHVKRIFQDAERHGLGGLEAGGMVWFSPEARAQLRMLFTAQLAHILTAAGVAAREVGMVAADDQKCAVGVTAVGD